ncbi:hypothetical protein LUZ60_005601 [Juncus effusus]|nr:hypothetical protein LUZ60_005601 [Juncus effusus]
MNMKTLLVIFVFLSSIFNRINGGKNNHEPSSVVIVGTLFCDACFEQDFSKSKHLISGASIEVECKDSSKNTVFRKTSLTNRKGVFKFNLPPEMSKNMKSINDCSIDLIKTNHATFCDASTSLSATSASGLHFKSKRKNDISVYSAGFFTFKPLKQPLTCDQKIAQPAFDFFPPNPFAPPNIGGVPVPGNPFQPPNIGGIPFPGFQPPPIIPGIPIPQNPFQPPPPSILPPIPGFQPPPPPSIIPTIPGFQNPSPPPGFNLPHLPFLNPPPPPPPPPVFQIPGFPFPPGFPGVPPGFPGFPSKKESHSP